MWCTAMLHGCWAGASGPVASLVTSQGPQVGVRNTWRRTRQARTVTAAAIAPAQSSQPGSQSEQTWLDSLLQGRQLSTVEKEELTLAYVRAFVGDSPGEEAARVPHRGRHSSSQPLHSSGSDSGTGSNGSGRQSKAGGRRKSGPAGKASGRPVPVAAQAQEQKPVHRQQHGDTQRSESGRGGQGQQHPQQAQQELPSCKPPTLIDQVVQHLCAGQFDEAFLATVPPEKLNWAIKALGARQRVDLAETLFHWMRLRRVANEHSFVKLCEACEAGAQPLRAVQAWRNMRRMQAGFSLGAPAAAALLKVYRARGDLGGGLALLEELEARPGLALNQYAYNIMLRMCADAGDLGAALRLLGRMRGGRGEALAGAGAAHAEAAAAAASSDDGRSAGGGAGRAGLVPRDERTYGAVLGAVRAAAAWNRTAAVHRWLREDGVRVGAVLGAQLLGCYAAGGYGAQAEQVLTDVERAGVRPNSTHYNALISAHAESRDWPACKEVYRRLLAGACRPDTYTMVALLRGIMQEAAQRAAEGLEGDHACDAEVAWVRQQMREHRVPLVPRVGTALIAYWLGAARGWQPRHLAAAQQAQQGQQQVGEEQMEGEQQHAQRQAQQAQRQGGVAAQQSQQQQHHQQQWQEELVQHAAAPEEGSSHAQGGGGRQQQMASRDAVRRRQQVALAEGKAVWWQLGQRERRLRLHHQQQHAQQQQQQENELLAPSPSQACSEFPPPSHHQQQQQRRRQQQGGGAPGGEHALDAVAYNTFMELQLAAGDYAGVLRTFGGLERSADVMPDGQTYRAAIEAAQKGGFSAKQQELVALQGSWSVLHEG